MIRRFGNAILALLLAACPATALAGDIASLQIIGFSADTKYFAFEEYGIQDGSGLPYSNIFVVDLEKDRFAEGFPVRMRIDGESAGLKQVRAMSTEKASHMLGKGGFDDDPGVLLAYNPVTEASANPHHLTFYPYPVVPLFGKQSTLTLFEVPFAALPEHCRPFLPEALEARSFIPGLRLSLTQIDGRPSRVTVHSEGHVPKSRGCPSGYRIGAVVASMKDPSVKVALILVLTYGFEGNDGRYIAVPLKEEAKP